MRTLAPPLAAAIAFVFLVACGSRNELTADRPPIAEHSFASGSRPPPAGALGGVLPVPEGIAYLGEWRTYGAPVSPYRCTFDPERFAPVGCEPTICYESGVFPTLQLQVAGYLLMVREARRSDLDACVADGRCVAGNFHPVERDYTDSLALSAEEARSFCRAYGGDVPTEAQFARALVDGEEFLPTETLAELAISPPGCLRGTPQPIGPDSPFGHRELAGREWEFIRSSGYEAHNNGATETCGALPGDDPRRLLAEAGSQNMGWTLPICEGTPNGVGAKATRFVSSPTSTSAFRCAFPTQVIP